MATENKRMLQRRGLASQLPSPTDGEIYIATDTKEMYFGAGGTMNKVPTMSDIAGGGSSVNVIDNLTSTSSTDALSANQGKVLDNNITTHKNDTTVHMTSSEKTKLDGIESGANKTVIDNTLTSISTTSALSANMGNTLNNNLTSLDNRITTHLDDYTPNEISLFISSTGGSDDNDGLTQETAIASFTKLTDLLNKYKSVNSVTINIDGEYERLEIFNLNNIVTIKSTQSDVKSKFKVSAYNCRDVRVIGADCVAGSDERVLAFYDVTKVIVTQSVMHPITGGIGTGIHLEGVSNFSIDFCEGNHLKTFLATANSFGVVSNITGSENVSGFLSTRGSRLTVTNNSLVATTLTTETDKGEVRI